MIIAVIGLLGAVIGGVIAEITIGLTYTKYNWYRSEYYTEFNEESIIYVVVGLALGIVIGCLIRLVLTNKNDKCVQVNATADEIWKLKILLDSGAVTQEEFDKKKKHLLDDNVAQSPKIVNESRLSKMDKEKIRRLENLYSMGEISQENYEKKRNEILNSSRK